MGLSELYGLARNTGLRTSLWPGLCELRPEGVGPQEEETDDNADEHRHDQGAARQKVHYTRSPMATDFERADGGVGGTGGMGTRTQATPT